MRRASSSLVTAARGLGSRGGERPRLSVCIPTLNRAEYLEQLLHSLVRHLGNQDVSFEIVVSDNCSDDATAAILAAWSGASDRIVAVRPPQRTDHAEDNVLFLIGHAQGEYVWLLGDDDDVVPSSVGELVSVVKEGVVDLAVFNSRSHDFYGRWLQDVRIPCNAVALDIPLSDFVARTGYWFVLSGFSTTLFRRDRANLEAFREMMRTSRIYSVVTWLVQQFWNRKFRFVNVPIVSYRQNLSDVAPNADDLRELQRERVRLEVSTGAERTAAAAEPHWARVARLENTFQKGIWTNKFLEQIDILCASTSMRPDFIAQVVDRNLDNRFVFSYEILKHFVDQLELWRDEGAPHQLTNAQMAYFVDWSADLFPDQAGVPIHLRRVEQAWLEDDSEAFASSIRRLRSVLSSLVQRPWFSRYHLRDWRGYQIYRHGGVWAAAHASRPDLAPRQFRYLDPSSIRPFFLSAATEAELMQEIEACGPEVEHSRVLEAVRVQNASEIANAVAAMQGAAARSDPSAATDAIQAIASSLAEDRNTDRERGAQLERELARSQAQVDQLRHELADLERDLDELATRRPALGAAQDVTTEYPWNLWSCRPDGR